MKTHRIRRSVLAGALSLAVFGSQSMEILTVSAASEELEYEGTTQISSTDYYPAFDTMSTALTVEEVYVEAGSSVQEGDAILKLTEDSYQSALDYYQAAIIRATNDLINEELAYAQGMQSAEYDLELALAYEEQAEFVQEQSEAELSDTIDEHKEVLTEMEERIEGLENGEYDSEEEAEEAMSVSGMSEADASGGGMSGAGGDSMGNTSETDRGNGGDLPEQTGTDPINPKPGNGGDQDGSTPDEENSLEGQIEELESEAEGLKVTLGDYQTTLTEYLQSESDLESKIKKANDEYYDVLSHIYELFALEEAGLTALSRNVNESALESAEETYEELQVIEEPQVEEPQIEEPQVEEPQIEEPQVEEPQIEEPQADELAEISGEEEAADSFEKNSGSEDSEDETEDETETETEEWDGIFDPEHPEKGGLLTVQISGGTITLEIPENAFTEAVSLQVSELTASYDALISGSVDAEDASLLYAVLNKAYENREGSWEDTDDQIYDFYLLDLSFINRDGAVVEPAVAIQVTVDHSAAPVNVGAAQADMGRTTEDLYRMAGGAAESVGSQIGLSNNGISSLSFTADSFSSPFVVLMIEAAGEEETETESETESVTEVEEAPDETEELINTLSSEDENEEETEDEKEEKYTELQDVLQQLYNDLENENEDGKLDDELNELIELIEDLDTGSGRAKILVSLNSLFKQIEGKETRVDSLNEAEDLVNQLAEMELENLDELISQLHEKESERQKLYEDYYKSIYEQEKIKSKLNDIINDFNLKEQIEELQQTATQEGLNVEQQIAALEQQNDALQKKLDELSEAASAGSALTGAELEAAESAAAGLTDQSDLSALAGMSGMDASSMANMSDTEALQMAEEELAAGLGESAISDEGVFDVQSILGAQESESLFGDEYDLTEAKALLERKATDADEAEELLDDLYPMQDSVQLDYEELLRLRKPLRLEIQYQYDETLLSARMAEITYDQTTKELEEELEAAMENLTDLEEEFQELEDLEDGTVRAAASGTLSAVYYEAEDTLFAVYPMYSIYDTDILTVLIAVPQSEIEKISVGEEVEVSLSSFGTTQGTVTEKAVEPQEGTSRTTVNYEVEISIDNSSGRLSSGTAATVTVTEA